MKPLLIVTLPEYSTEEDYSRCVKHFERLYKDGFLEDYETIVLTGASAKVYYPQRNWLKFYYYKIKAWVILKIWKNK